MDLTKPARDYLLSLPKFSGMDPSWFDKPYFAWKRGPGDTVDTRQFASYEEGLRWNGEIREQVKFSYLVKEAEEIMDHFVAGYYLGLKDGTDLENLDYKEQY
jgi:hypothetical protein